VVLLNQHWVVEVFFYCIITEGIDFIDAVPADFLRIILEFILRNKGNQSLRACFEDMLECA
jgi:hypothetical protein